ncbi:MAG: nuclear transport factor 2 family protein [Sphingobacteriia bacterium]
MKYVFLSCFFFFSMISINAQSKDSIAVVAAVEQLRMAMISGNQDDLNGIASDHLSYGHSGGHVEGKKEFVEKIASGKSDFIAIELSEQSIMVVGKTAIVRHSLNATTNDNGKPGTVKLKVMLVFQKEKGKWLMLARQAVKLS